MEKILTRKELHNQLSAALSTCSADRPLALLLLYIKDWDLHFERLTPLAADKLLDITAKAIYEAAPKDALLTEWNYGGFGLLLPRFSPMKLKPLLDDINTAVKNQKMPAIMGYEGIELRFNHGIAYAQPSDAGRLIMMAEWDLAAAQANAFSFPCRNEDAYGESLKVARLILAKNNPYLTRHAALTADIATNIASTIGLSARDGADISIAALWANISMLSLGSAILDKPGSLTLIERQRVMLHPAWGAQSCMELGMNQVAPIVLAHHEHENGSGYPHGIGSEEMPLGARILATASAYAALLLPRPYRPARGVIAAREEMAAAVMKGELWSEAVKAIIYGNLNIAT